MDISVKIPGLNQGDPNKIQDLTITEGTTLKDVRRELGLGDYDFFRNENEPIFENQDLHRILNPNEKISAIPSIEVG